MNTKVKDLSELIFQLRDFPGKTPADYFAHLRSLTGGGIKIKHEILSTDETIETLEDVPYGHLNKCKIGRVLLTANRSVQTFKSKLHRQCNGVVLEYPTWNILAMPPPLINSKFRIADVAKHISEYTIYKINDGTTVTLYYYKDEWCMASTNGFDISNYKWIGDKSYRELFDEVALLYPDFNLDTLDRNYCYVIGFRHQVMHPLLSEVNRMWYIMSYDLNLINKADIINYRVLNIGLPEQSVFTTNKIRKNDIVKILCANNKHALQRYKQSCGGNTPNINYGYILRSDSLPNHLECNSDIIMESSLLNKLKQMIYNVRPTALELNNTNRMFYIILQNYLGYESNHEFMKLFPQYTTEYNRIDTVMTALINEVITRLRVWKQTVFQDESKLSKLATVIANKIKNEDINVLEPSGCSIVSDLVKNRDFIHMYFDYFMNLNE